MGVEKQPRLGEILEVKEVLVTQKTSLVVQGHKAKSLLAVISRILIAHERWGGRCAGSPARR